MNHNDTPLICLQSLLMFLAEKFLFAPTLLFTPKLLFKPHKLFTATPNSNNIELKSNIQNYTRRLRLADFFQNKEASDCENLFQNQSTFTPPRDRDRDIMKLKFTLLSARVTL